MINKWVCHFSWALLLLKCPALSALNVYDLHEKALHDFPQSYVLPLSYEEDPPLLLIPIPDGFKLGYDGSSYPDVMYLDFIRQDQDPAYPSETITICQSKEVLDAHVFIKAMRTVIEENQLLEDATTFTSIISCAFEHGVKIGLYLGDLPSFKPQQLGIQAPRYNELLHVKSIQGEDRVWVIQYSIRYNPETTSEVEYDILIDKLDDFFDSCKVVSNLTESSL